MPKRLQTHLQRLRLSGRRTPEDRPPPSKRGYDRRWMRLRRWFLARHPLCAHCLKRGFTTPATEVDHIKPLREGGARLDQSNLQALCKSCHSRKTAREGVRRSDLCRSHGEYRRVSHTNKCAQFGIGVK